MYNKCRVGTTIHHNRQTNSNLFLLCLHFCYAYNMYIYMFHVEKFDEFIKNKSEFQMSKTCYKNLFAVSTEFNSKQSHYSCMATYYIIHGRFIKLTDIGNNTI